MATYSVFVRNWWIENPVYPNGLEPCPGKKRYLAKGLASEKEAQALAQEYNRTHKPGRLSRKAEYERK